MKQLFAISICILFFQIINGSKQEQNQQLNQNAQPFYPQKKINSFKESLPSALQP